MASRVALPVLFALCAFSVNGYVFPCLDGCECDTDDEVIHCHNGERSQLALPQGQRLRGFPVIGLTYNNIQRLPDEATLLSKFPDLKVVDVERNPFDCASLSQYNGIKIISDCYKNASEIAKVPKVFRPTPDCNMACQAQKHYDKLHEYCLQLWEIIKEKYRNFDKDETLRKIKEFFMEVVSKVKELSQQYLNPASSSRNEDLVHNEVATPFATPEPTQTPQNLEVD